MGIVCLNLKHSTSEGGLLSVNPVPDLASSPTRIVKSYASYVIPANTYILVDSSVLTPVMIENEICYIIPIGTFIYFKLDQDHKIAETAQPLLVTGPPITIQMS